MNTNNVIDNVIDNDVVNDATSKKYNENKQMEEMPQDRPMTNNKNDDKYKLLTLDQVKEETQEWLIPFYIPKGEITIMAGTGGVGKSTVVSNIIASITSGIPSVLNETVAPAVGKVMYFSAEDSISKVIVPRLKRNGADLSRILTMSIDDPRFDRLTFNSKYLEELIANNHPALVIFDPLQSFIPSNIQMSSRNAMRNCMRNLDRFGTKYGVTFLIVMHTNKRGGVWGRERMADSADIWDIGRSVLMVGKENPEDPNSLTYISQEKANNSLLQPTIEVQLDNGRVVYSSQTTKKDKDFVLANSLFSKKQSEEKMEKIENGRNIILSLLKDSPDGRMEARDLEYIAINECGLPTRVFKKARAELKNEGIISLSNYGFGEGEKKYFWSLSS